LKSVALGWIRHSGATAREKLELLDDLLRSRPSIGWKALIAVWPDNHAVVGSPHTPKFRDWTPDTRKVSWAEWAEFVDGLISLALIHAGNQPSRWRELIERANSLPAQYRRQLLQGLANANMETWTADERFSVWDVLRTRIRRHEEFPDAKRAMPVEELEEWRAIASTIEPRTDPRRYAHLFAWHTRIGQLKYGDDGFEEELDRRQRAAVETVATQGIDDLKALTLDAKTPRRVGMVLAGIAGPSLDREVLSWLDTDESNLRQAALGLADERVAQLGFDWLRSALAWPELKSDRSKENLMSAVPAAKQYWSEVHSLGDQLEAAYWNRVNSYQIAPGDHEEAVYQLVEHDLPWSAINVLANAVHHNVRPTVELIKAAFKAVVTNAGPIADQTMTSYSVQQLLQYMEATTPNDPDLPAIEFTFFEFVHDHQPSGALYRALESRPSEFVSLMKLVFRAEGGPKREPTADENVRAQIALSVLHEWPTVPGQQPDSTIDAERLNEWVRAARLGLADCGRSAIGDEVIGQILSASPDGPDEIWPALPIRELVETIGSARLATGLHIGLHNRRGFTSRGVLDGGKQEWELEAKYRDMAIRANKEWPRTARILRGIADSYRDLARREDAEAEEFGDRG
jgi:hypothetical protein